MPVTEGAGKVQGDNFITYHLLCGCGNPKCVLALRVNYDKFTDTVEVSFEGDLVSPAGWCQRVWDRIVHALRILFTGSTSASFVFEISRCDHVYGIVGALLEARRRMQRAGKPFNQAGRLEDKRGQ